jgi:hypothetical protein
MDTGIDMGIVTETDMVTDMDINMAMDKDKAQTAWNSCKPDLGNSTNDNLLIYLSANPQMFVSR